MLDEVTVTTGGPPLVSKLLVSVSPVNAGGVPAVKVGLAPGANNGGVPAVNVGAGPGVNEGTPPVNICAGPDVKIGVLPTKVGVFGVRT